MALTSQKTTNLEFRSDVRATHTAGVAIGLPLPIETDNHKGANVADKNLVKIIRSNPGCIAWIDNDYWEIKKAAPPDEYDDWDCKKQSQWDEANILASSRDDIATINPNFSGGNCYGGDILAALAEIVGIKLESA